MSKENTSAKVTMLTIPIQKVSECDQEIPQLHTADQPTAGCQEEPQNIYSNNTFVRQ